ncbi:DUF968 domain-containing protein [Acinetobacter cumulans]|uniref:DUF968 domain-containing protein n=1 Tax=Acinetobacter cumulans TaxID=2136182 RepID=A0A3A8FLM1_9GAMM|nr:DUF968 domain-containing protein [Acinetobacter cumulans]RKG47259.1 DUF968 domain-containing protein [Acinetobacter cumulans]
MRSAKRLAEIRKLPCVRCGQSPSQAAHSNSSKHGKGRGIKADDAYTVPLCHSCHSQFDQYKLGSRGESEKLFEQWLVRVERMLNQTDKDIF